MLKKYPESVQLSLLMGNTQLAKNNIAEAERNFKSGIEQSPKEEAGYIALSNLYVRQKNYDQAVKLLQDGLREQPSSLNLKLSLAVNLFQKGDYEGAIANYESILKDKPKIMVAINNLATLLLDYRTDNDSLNRAYALSEELKSSPLPQFQGTVGWAQYKRGDFNATLEAAQVKIATADGALADSANPGSLRYHLGMSYIATGQTEKATEQLKAALQAEPDGSPMKDKIRSALK